MGGSRSRRGAVLEVSLEVADRRRRELLNESKLDAGRYSIPLGGAFGRQELPAGLYFYRVETGEGVLGGRFALMR